MTNTSTAFFNDSLDDLLGGTPSPLPKTLPMDDASVRIRQNVETFSETCPKCRGTGKFITYSGRVMGECFTCKGKGSKTFKTSSAQRQQNRERAADRKEQQRVDNGHAFEKANPAEFSWITRNAGKFDFATAMAEAVFKYGDLTERQRDAVHRCMAREADRAAAAEKRAAAAPSIDGSKLIDAFNRAKDRVRSPDDLVLYFDGFVIYEAEKYPGTFYVKSGKRWADTYFGKIMNNRFMASRDCTQEMNTAILAVLDDPAGAARAAGKKTGRCCCCGRKLTNENSIAAGIGPICAGNFGF